jgi:hypothetical protein
MEYADTSAHWGSGQTTGSSRDPAAGIIGSVRHRLVSLFFCVTLVLLGLVLGRMLSSAETRPTILAFERELTSLRAELAALSQHSAREASRSALLEQMLADERQQAAQEQSREVHLSAQRVIFEQAAQTNQLARQSCLRELGQFTGSRQAVPAGDVLRVVTALFDTQDRLLSKLAQGTPVSLSDTMIPFAEWEAIRGQSVPLQPTIAEAAAPPSAGQPVSSTTRTGRATPAGHRSSGSKVANLAVSNGGGQSEARFFPPPLRAPRQYTFLSPSRNTGSQDAARTTGIVFIDGDTPTGTGVRR